MAKADTYQIITDRIVSLLEQGTVPWRKPWKGSTLSPRSYAAGRPYRGINSWLLACQGYSSPYWLTFNQARKLGGCVRKGEKGTPVVLWKWIKKEKANGTTETFPLLRYYTVFNETQVDGIPLKHNPETAPTETVPTDAACETILEGFKGAPFVTHGGDRACYRPGLDTVSMPERDTFASMAAYYSILWHELGHSTGHKDRLARKGVMEVARFGSSVYSKEELVAEMTAAYLCGHVGIEDDTIDASASYLAGWLAALKSDSKLVVQAAANAQKAADHILGSAETEATDE